MHGDRSMAQFRIPQWWYHGIPSPGSEAVTEAFRAVVKDLPMTHTALAEELGVAQSTVSRWVKGSHDTELEQMIAVVDTVSEHLDQLQERVDRARQLLDGAQAIVEADKRYSKTKKPRDLQKREAAIKQLNKLAMGTKSVVQ